jgi:hypothetical protein
VATRRRPSSLANRARRGTFRSGVPLPHAYLMHGVASPLLRATTHARTQPFASAPTMQLHAQPTMQPHAQPTMQLTTRPGGAAFHHPGGGGRLSQGALPCSVSLHLSPTANRSFLACRSQVHVWCNAQGEYFYQLSKPAGKKEKAVDAAVQAITKDTMLLVDGLVNPQVDVRPAHAHTYKHAYTCKVAHTCKDAQGTGVGRTAGLDRTRDSRNTSTYITTATSTNRRPPHCLPRAHIQVGGSMLQLWTSKGDEDHPKFNPADFCHVSHAPTSLSLPPLLRSSALARLPIT